MPQAAATPAACHVDVPSPARRQIIGGTVLAALTGAFATSPVIPADPAEVAPASEVSDTSDAWLISLCARCDALQDHVDALHVRPADNMPIAQELAWEQARDLLVAPITDRQESLLERICALRATTARGHAARARTLLGWDKDVCWGDDSPCWSNQLIGAVIRDLVDWA